MNTDTQPSDGSVSDGNDGGDDAGPTEYVECLVFEIADRPVAIEVGRIERVLEDPPIDRLPGTGPEIVGAAAAGSGVAVVIDLATVMTGSTTPDPEADADAEVLLLAEHGHEQAAAVRIDADYEIRNLAVDDLTASIDGTPDGSPDIDPAYVLATTSTDGTDRTAVLDVPRIVHAAVEGEVTAGESRTDKGTEAAPLTETEQGFEFGE